MGKNNRKRRAAKQRKYRQRQARQQERAQRQPSDRAHEDPRDLAAVYLAAVQAHHMGEYDALDHLVDTLASAPRARLARDLQRRLEQVVSKLWTHGWQPAVLDRAVSRQLGRRDVALLRCVIAAESESYEALGREVAPEWMSQLDAIDATRWWSPDQPYLVQLPGAWDDVLRAAVRVRSILGSLPKLPTLDPPPATWRSGMTSSVRSTVPSVLLEKVRALLAKAESTSFDAEAEAFTAKAQELMTRHRIDRAVLESATSTDESPAGRRVFIDDPYADAKAMLLGVICGANGANAVWSKELGFSTVFGFGNELDTIEDLFTSLLVQASAALQREGSKTDRAGRSRTTRFRRSFLVAFATRIGRRLREAADAAVIDAEAETGRSLVPVLASRADAAHDAATDAFPELTSFSPAATDGEGWFAGTMFGDRADLGVGAPVTERAAS